MNQRDQIASLLEEGRQAPNVQMKARAHERIRKMFPGISEGEQVGIEEVIATYIGGKSLYSAREAAEHILELSS